MRKIVLFMHTSLDGLVAGPDGEMDWIKVDQEMFDFASERTNKSDMAIYGRGTYDIMEAYWPTAADKPDATKHDIEHSAWYSQVQKLVISRTLKDTTDPKVKIIRNNLPEEIHRLKNTEGNEIIMFGSPGVAKQLMKENLIDDYWLFVNPIILGQGISLFEPMDTSIKLKLKANTIFNSGVVCLHYELSI
jgi:dihydrofolate reductase